MKVRISKTSYAIAIILLLICFLTVFVSCTNKDTDTREVLITGDISGKICQVQLLNIQKEEFADNQQARQSGYNLAFVLDRVQTLSADSWVLIISTDNRGAKMGARIDIKDSALVYLVESGNQLNVVAPLHPRVVGIKGVQEIVIIEKESANNGIKVITQNVEYRISYGNFCLQLFEQVASNSMGDIVAYKHTAKERVNLEDIFERECLLYFDNYDIIKADSGLLDWDNGRAVYTKDNKNYQCLIGVITATDTLIYDAFFDIKSALQEDKKVMYILPDGLSMEQIEHYSEQLSLFSRGYRVAASVNPAISNVALATIVTGQSPYVTGITERGIKRPNAKDIFEYASEMGKGASYIEGDSNLILTSLAPSLNMADVNGYTDSRVYEKARAELVKDPDLLFVHFHGIDDVNHEYSPISEEALAKIIEVEGYIKSLIQDFEGIVVIVPDHGAVTYLDNEGVKRGKHGIFEKRDMLVPYYIIDTNED